MKSIHFIISCLDKVKGLFILSIIIAVTNSISQIMAVYLQKYMIDDVIIHERYSLFNVILTLMVSSYIIYFLMSWLSPYINKKTAFKLHSVWSRKMMQYLYNVPVSEFQKQRTAEYMNFFTKDIENSSLMFGQDFINIIQQITGMVLLMCIIGGSSPSILAGITLFGLLYIVAGKKFGSTVRTASRKVEDKSSDLLVHIEEGISSTREVIAFHRMEWENRIYNEKFNILYQSMVIEGKLFNKYFLSTDPLRWCANLIVLVYGGYLVYHNSLSIGTFIVLYQFTSRLLENFQGVLDAYLQLSKKMANVDRIRMVIESKLEDTREYSVTNSNPMLCFEDVTFRYSDETDLVLNHVNLDIPYGKKIAFIGGSGGGKSTIAQLLIQFFKPTNGRILVNGVPLNQVNPRYWKERISIIFQEPYFFPDTIYSNLVLGQESVSKEIVITACKMALIHDCITQLPNGYEEVIGERGITLSGGERQRLAIARALIRDTEILVLDEATSALDQETERLLLKNLDAFRKGRTTIVIAHRLSTVRNADYIYVMKKGTIAEQGTHEQLMESGSLYRNLIYSQATGIN